MATKKAQVLITANASQATQALQDLQRLALLLADDIKDATAQMQAFVKAGDTANAKAMQKNIDGMTNRMNAYTTAVDKHIEKTKKLGEVVADLSNSKLRELKAAMGQGKSMLQGLTGSDDDLRKARGIQQMMKQVGDQIRLIEGEYAKMPAILKELSVVSDNTLQKAIKQQEALVAGLRKTDMEYVNQANILRKLKAEQERRTAPMTVGNASAMAKNTQNASIAQMRNAVSVLTKELERIPSGSNNVKILRREIESLQQAIKKAGENTISINAVMNKMKAGKATLSELKAAYKHLEDELQKVSIKSQDFANKQKQMTSIKKQIDSATGAINNQSSAWQTALRNLTAYVGLFAVFNQVKQYFTDLFKLNMQFSDQLVNIRKVSGLAMTDIERLSNTLSKIDTRTTVQELNNIAYAGAKLGIGDYGVAALEGFTRAANQVNVALKEDLGEEALTSLSKITEVMGLIPQLGVEESMLKTGSAIFKLASTSTATSGKIIDFSNRLLAMGKEGALSTADILALGAAVDAMALEPEVASTAFNKMIVEIRKGTTSLEKDLGIAEGRLKSLVEQGKGMEAIQTIFHAMAGKDNVFALENLFGDLGSEGGARMVKTMVTMANSVGMLDKAVRTANVAFDEGSAVTMEYNMQQETAAAYMERAANLWEKQFINATNANGPIKEIAQSWYEMTQALLGAGEATGGFNLALETLVATVKLGINLIPLFVSFLMTKGIGAAVTALTPMISTFCSTAYAGFQSLIGAMKAGAVATGGFTAKWKAMDAAMKANVIGIVVGLAAQLVYWISQYERELTSAEKAQRKLNDVHEQAVNNIQVEVTRLEALNAMAHDQNVLLEDRKKAIDILNETVPEYNGQLDETTGKYKANEEALRKWNDQLLRNAEIEGAKTAIADLSGQLANAEGRRFKAEQDLAKTPKPKEDYSDVDPYSGFSYGFVNQAQKRVDAENKVKEAKKEADDIRAQLNAIKDRYSKDIAESYVKVTPDEKKTGGGTGNGKSTTNGKTNNEQSIAKSRANALIADIKAYYEEQQRKYLVWVAEMNKDGEKVSEGEVEQYVSKLRENMDTAVGIARQSVATAGENWDHFKKHLSDDLYGTATETDKRLIRDIENADVKELHALFSKLSSDLSKENHKTLSENLGALLDEIFKNGSEDLRKAAERLVQRQFELQKMLADMNYTRSVNRETRSNLDKNALLPTADNVDASSTEGQQQMALAFDTLLKKVRDAQSDLWAFNMETEEGRKAFLAWLSDPDIKKGFDFRKSNVLELSALWMELIKYPDRYTEAKKKQYDLAKKVAEQSWKNAKANIDKQNAILAAQDFKNKYGKQSSFLSNLGLADIKNDPEVQLMRLRMKAAEEYYEFVRKKSQDQQLLAEADKARQEAEMAYMKQMVANMKERAAQLGSFVEPVVEFGSAMGEAFAKMRDDADSANEAIKAAVKSMITSFGKKLIDDLNKQMWQSINNGIAKSMTVKATGEIQDSRAAAEQNISADLTMAAGRTPENPLYVNVVNGGNGTPGTPGTSGNSDGSGNNGNSGVTGSGSSTGTPSSQSGLLNAGTDIVSGVGNAVASGNGQDIGNNLISGVTNALTTTEFSVGGKSNEKKQSEKDRKQEVKNAQQQAKQLAKVKKQGLTEQTKATQTANKEMTSTTKEGGDDQRKSVELSQNAMTSAVETAGNIQVQTKQKNDQAVVQSSGETAQAETTFSLVGAIGKCFEFLGPIAGPIAAAVVTSTLMGLLQWAMSSAFGSSSDKKTSTNSINTKVVSGMLTYDEGNVSQYVGTDGNVYSARNAGNLPSGVSMITSPIATTVNGSPALVAERGPEIVIGRQTTAAIMQNAPYILSMLAQYDRNRSVQPMRLYDDGNISDIDVPNTQHLSPNTQDDTLNQTLAALTTVLTNLQRDGVRAHINKYGKGGLVDEVQSGLAFLSKHS